MKVWIFLLFFIISFNCFPFTLVRNLKESDFYLISQDKKGSFYLVSKSCVYKGKLRSSLWKKVFCSPPQDFITDIFLDRVCVYIATKSKVYFSKDGENFNIIFKVFPKTKINCVFKKEDKIYIGTTEGLYFKDGNKSGWKKLNFLQDVNIFQIISNKQNLILATDHGVFISKDSKIFEKRFVVQSIESSESNLIEEKEKNLCIPIFIKVDEYDTNKIYLATSCGLFVSKNRGFNFKKIYLKNLFSVPINCIAQTAKDEIILATDRGLYKVDLNENYAKRLYQGITTNIIRWVFVDRNGKILIATPKGIFVSSTTNFKNNILSSTFNSYLFAPEPDILTLQKVALEWNEVHPDKIKKWRKALLKRALYPAVNLKVGGSCSDTYEIYTSSTKSYYVLGPLQRDIDWSVSISWDLGDLIWSPYEKDIDSRSRLNTQLRLDILNELNRLYFERKALKEELLEKSSSLSKEELQRKILLLEELTANLDALTGGYFSKKLKESFERCKK